MKDFEYIIDRLRNFQLDVPGYQTRKLCGLGALLSRGCAKARNTPAGFEHKINGFWCNLL